VQNRSDWLSRLLLDKGAVAEEADQAADHSFFPIFVPGLNPPRSEKEAKRRKLKREDGELETSG
jgi:hypothetical protein